MCQKIKLKAMCHFHVRTGEIKHYDDDDDSTLPEYPDKVVEIWALLKSLKPQVEDTINFDLGFSFWRKNVIIT